MAQEARTSAVLMSVILGSAALAQDEYPQFDGAALKLGREV